jgi:hypothetical protein
MKTFVFSLLSISFSLMLIAGPAFSQRKEKNKKGTTPVDEVKKPDTKPKGQIKPYSELIAANAVSDWGLFKVHKVNDKFYYEIPDSLLRRDFLWISRLASLPAGLGGGYVNAGTKVHEQVVTWEKKEKKILLKTKSYSANAPDSLPIYLSVQANNLQPTIYAFPIESISPDSRGYVIDVTKFFLSDIKAFSGLTAEMRKDYKVSKLDEDRSFINSIKSFPLNIEVKHETTFDATEPPSNKDIGVISIEMSQSLILLPKKPMQPRLFDFRVGWLTVNQIDYGSEALKADQIKFIRRWRLEPKDEQAYRRGELVEPKKPIVYYLDAATPEKLRPYIRAGIEQWLKVFETAGFKNAIQVKDPPKDDPDFSPEDVRYSVIRYVASTTRNAIGPSVSDPRSGEIIESDIIWYHNHLRSYRNRYLIETGAANPSARTLNTTPEEIGEMMRQVITHEVGHALGLPHNMKASYSYPTDSLRSGTFTQKFGIAASVMDYARFNYVAQPGDKGIRFVRQIGPYDHYAINWGYRWIPDVSSATGELPTLNKWIEEKASDPVYQFGSGAGNFDPASQTECIGNDPIKSSSYGLQNLKIVSKNLSTWTSAQTNDYDDLEEIYVELISVWSRYISHVSTNIGGVKETRLKPDQKGYVYTPVDAATQRLSLEWMLKNAFSTPTWLQQKEIVRNIHPANEVETIRKLQERHLNSLLSFNRLAVLMENEAKGVPYQALNMIDQLQTGIWKEVATGAPIDIYRRNLQKAYLERMEYLLTKDDVSPKNSHEIFVEASQSDIRSIVRGELRKLSRQVNSGRSRYGQTVTGYHLDDVLARIQLMLNPRK